MLAIFMLLGIGFTGLIGAIYTYKLGLNSSILKSGLCAMFAFLTLFLMNAFALQMQ